MKTVISASLIWSLIASTGMAQTRSPEESIQKSDEMRAQIQKNKALRDEAQARLKAAAPVAPPTTAPSPLDTEVSMDTFDKDEIPGVKVTFKCFFNVEKDPDLKNREICRYVLKARANDPSTRISGGIDISVNSPLLKNAQLRTDGGVQTESGTLYAPDFSKFNLGTSLTVDGETKSDDSQKPEEIQKVESETHTSALLFTAQKIGTGAQKFASALKRNLNPDLQFFGVFAENVNGTTTPFYAALLQVRHEFKTVVGLDKLGVKRVNVTASFNPFAMLLIKNVRNGVRNGEDWEHGIEEAAIHDLSTGTGVPTDRIRELMPHDVVEAAIHQQRALAEKNLKKRLSIGNGIRAMVNEAYATFFLTEPGAKKGWTIRLGKISPNQQRDLMPLSTNLMFSSGYQVSARHSTESWAATIVVGAMMGPQESSTGGLVEAWIIGMLEQGPDYFQLKPNSVDFNFTLKEKFFKGHKIPVVTGMMAGAGAVSGQPFGYFRMDAEVGPVSANYLGSWQSCKSGSETWLGCYGGVQHRHFISVAGELEHVKGVSKVAHELRYEGYGTFNSKEPFFMNRVVVARALPGFIQKACATFGSCSGEFSFAKIKNMNLPTHGDAHAEAGGHARPAMVTVIGGGITFGFKKKSKKHSEEK